MGAQCESEVSCHAFRVEAHLFNVVNKAIEAQALKYPNGNQITGIGQCVAQSGGAIKSPAIIFGPPYFIAGQIV